MYTAAVKMLENAFVFSMISFLFKKSAIALIPFSLFCHCFIDLSIIELFQLADTRQENWLSLAWD